MEQTERHEREAPMGAGAARGRALCDAALAAGEVQKEALLALKAGGPNAVCAATGVLHAARLAKAVRGMEEALALLRESSISFKRASSPASGWWGRGDAG